MAQPAKCAGRADADAAADEDDEEEDEEEEEEETAAWQYLGGLRSWTFRGAKINEHPSTRGHEG